MMEYKIKSLPYDDAVCEVREPMAAYDYGYPVVEPKLPQYKSGNKNLLALRKFQNAMAGVAEEAGFKDPDDVMVYIKQLRKSKKTEYAYNG